MSDEADDSSIMRYCRPAVRAPVRSAFGFEDAFVTPRQRAGALAMCAVLVVTVVLATVCGIRPGPEIKPFIPVTATIWSLADLLTAFLLLGQFYVNGNLFFGILAGAYAFTGLSTWPYLAAFPGVLRMPSTVGDEQTSIYLWSIWHCVFPATVICAVLTEWNIGRIVSARSIFGASILIVLAPIVISLAVAAIVFEYRSDLLSLVIGGHVQPFFRTAFVPVIILLDLAACFLLLRERQRLTPLKLWLAVAMFSGTLDSFLNLSGFKFSYAWDTGKLITVFTGSVVLIMILCDIVGLYSRLAYLASIDVLTSLHNRRAFEEHLELVFKSARRTHGGMALLVIDIDFFKRYNDLHGHLGGDECLRQVAHAMRECIHRPLDLIARYGGEEFVVVLPETPLAGAVVLAERIRAAVEKLEIRQGEKPLGGVTVSIGIAFVADALEVDEAELFEAADRGLYAAKERGRNQASVGNVVAASPPVVRGAVA